jgi:hypothetical protein
MAGMKKVAVFAQTLAAVVTFVIGGVFVVLIISCSSASHQSGSSIPSANFAPPNVSPTLTRSEQDAEFDRIAKHVGWDAEKLKRDADEFANDPNATILMPHDGSQPRVVHDPNRPNH